MFVAVPNRWTSEQVRALAPDPSSLAAARDLATPGKWLAAGAIDDGTTGVWGLCRGSGVEAVPDVRRSRRSGVPVFVPEPEVPVQARARSIAAVGGRIGCRD